MFYGGSAERILASADAQTDTLAHINTLFPVCLGLPPKRVSIDLYRNVGGKILGMVHSSEQVAFTWYLVPGTWKVDSCV